MKVGELIEILKTYDEDLKVIVYEAGFEDGGLAHNCFAEEVYETSYKLNKYTDFRGYTRTDVWTDDDYETDCVVIR